MPSTLRRTIRPICSARKAEPISENLLLSSYISVQSFMVAHPDRGLARETHVNEIENASSFSNLRLTADGTHILLNFLHRDGRKGVITLDSSTFSDLFITWNGTVAIHFDKFSKKTSYRQIGNMRMISIN